MLRFGLTTGAVALGAQPLVGTLAANIVGCLAGGVLLGAVASLHTADNPDLVFVLTRSINRSVGFDAEANNRDVLDALESINPVNASGRRPARIKTIQFLDDDPTGLLQEIAERHGDGAGSYRLVGRTEVLQQERDGEKK